MEKYIHTSKYFYGKKLTDEEIERGYISYATLASCFDAVLCNNIANNIFEEGEQTNGFIDNSDEISDAEEEIESIEEKFDQIAEEIENLEQSLENVKSAEDIAEIENRIAELQQENIENQKRIEGLKDHIDEMQNEQDNPQEVYQWFIISDNGAEILKDLTDELVYYLPSLDVYVWGVCHWGTSWDYVSTDIRIKLDEGVC